MHIDQEMSIRSSVESKQIRLRLCELKNQRAKLMRDMFRAARKSDPECLILDEKISEVAMELERNNLGLEHLIREIGRVYGVLVFKEHQAVSEMLVMIKKLAELVIEGQVLELVDGDAGEISGPWLNAVLQEINAMRPGMKIFVISILGLQSSGKSTLFNNLFGCKFSVSSGRCTRGLFMRLLFLDETVRHDTRYDAIILIDTEGMCAPEKMMHKNSSQRDRELATFSMLASDLTLINIMGETMTEITDILQIVVVTIARLEKVFTPPDIALLQHCSEVDRSKFECASSQFCEAINKAIEMSDAKYKELGVVNSAALSKLCASIEDDLLHLFHLYRNGASPNAPPTEEYHVDVKKFYEKVLGIMKRSKRHTPFSEWHSLLLSYWNCIKKEDFSLRFKNIKEIHEFIERGSRIAAVNEVVEEALSQHRGFLKRSIRNILLTADLTTDAETLKDKYLHIINYEINNKTLHQCPSLTPKSPQGARTFHKCSCKAALDESKKLMKYVQGALVEDEVNKTLKSYIRKAKSDIIKQLEDYADNQVEHYFFHRRLEAIVYNTITGKGSSFKTNRQNVDDIYEYILSEAGSMTDTYKVEKDKQVLLDETMAAYYGTPITRDKKRLQLSHTNTTFDNIGAYKGFFGYVRKLSSTEASKLKIDIGKIVNSLVKSDGVELERMVKLRQRVNEILEAAKRSWGPLTFEFSWEVQVYSIQLFFDQYEQHYIKSCLKVANEATFTILRTKLFALIYYPSKYSAVGRILAESILYAVLKKAKKTAQREVKNLILNQMWLSSVENVRLTFFESILEEVRMGFFENALTYFRDPAKTITDWFAEEVDQADPVFLKTNASKIYNQEITELWARIEQNGILDTCLEYLSCVDDIQYSFDFTFNSKKDEDDFANSFYQTFHEKKTQFSGITYKRCSDSKAVRDRLGCTQFCSWCGALCWGHALHELNEDITRRHHTCHQPQGLSGITGGDGHLVAVSCENIVDDQDLRVKSGCDAEGLTWQQIRQGDEFDNWIFINHSVDDYNNMMSWFFFKLNGRIANFHGVKGCPEETMKEIGMPDLDSRVDSMLANIKQRIQ